MQFDAICRFGGWGTTWPIEAAALPCALAILHLTPGVIGGSNKEAQPRQSSHRKNRRKTWNILEPIGLMDTYGYLWDLMGMEMIGNDWKWYVWHVHGPIMVQYLPILWKFRNGHMFQHVPTYEWLMWSYKNVDWASLVHNPWASLLTRFTSTVAKLFEGALTQSFSRSVWTEECFVSFEVWIKMIPVARVKVLLL